MDNEQKDYLPDLNLHMDESAKSQFAEAAKWSKFISVVMFALAGIFLVAGLIGGSLLGNTMGRLGGKLGDIFELGGGLIVAIVVFVVAVMVVVYYFLFSFSQKIKNAILSDNKEELVSAFRMLKIFFILTTIFSILGVLNDIYKLF